MAADSRRIILYVEDHRDTRVTIVRLLTSIGYEVRAAACVREALDIAQDRQIALLIADIGLPDGNGLSLLPEIRKLYPLSGIIFSGYGMPHDLARSEAAGYCKHLVKPLNANDLIKAIEEAFNDVACSEPPDGATPTPDAHAF